MVELGRSCVHADYRSGAVIMALWSGLAQYMQKHDYEIMLGCASIPMADGGHFAASLFNSLRNDQMAPIENHAFPKLPLPLEKLNGGLEVEPPPLIKGYLKLGAKICSAPAWDPDFNTADLLTMLRLSEINPRYAKHFLGLWGTLFKPNLIRPADTLPFGRFFLQAKLSQRMLARPLFRKRNKVCTISL